MPLDESALSKINFPSFNTNDMFRVLKSVVSARQIFEQPQHMFKMMGKKIFKMLLSNIVYFELCLYICYRYSLNGSQQ